MLPLIWAAFCIPASSFTPSENDAGESTGPFRSSRELPSDDRVNLALQDLRDAIGKGHRAAMLSAFRRLTGTDTGILVARADRQTFVPLHQVLAEEFEKLPADIQTSLRSANARPAQLALKRAVASGRWPELLRVAHRFAGTDSAHSARLLLIQLHLDRGNHLAAAHWLHGLPTSSVSPAGRSVIRQLQSRLPPGPDHASTQSQDELPDVTVPASSDWRIRWQQRPQLNSVMQRQIDTAESSARVVTSNAWNAVVRDTVLYRRSLRGLTATSVRTGTVNWALPLQPSHLDQLGHNTDRSYSARSSISVLPEQIRKLLIHDGARNRISAGKDAVYLVTASAAPDRLAAARFGRGAGKPEARLVAVSSHDGRRIWSVGGPGEDDGRENPLAGVWFAGPPCVDGESLHSVVQRGSEIRLVTLRARTGEVLHSTLLGFSEESIDRNPERRLTAATPLSTSGLLLCSTTTGWIIAVDGLTRSVVWATRANGTRQAAVRSQSPDLTMYLLGETIAAVPWNSRELHFVDAVSGKRRQLFRSLGSPGVLAVIDNDLIIVTANEQMERVAATTTEPIWQRVLLPEDGLPCGSGLIVNDQLLLAMTTGAVICVNVSTGAIVNSTADVLRPSRHGMLLDACTEGSESTDSAGGDVFFIGPTDTICLTRDSVSTTPVEQIERQLAAGELQSAWESVTQSVSDRLPTDDRTSALRYKIAFELALDERLPGNVSLEDLAVNHDQRVLAAALRIARRSDAEPIAAAAAAIGLLQAELEAGRLRRTPTMLPVRLLPYPAPGDREVSRSTHQQDTSVSLRTWAARIVEHALQQPLTDARDELVLRLAELNPETIMQIADPLAADAIQLQLDNSTQPEQSLHLRLHLKTVLSDPDALQAAELEALPGQFENSSESPRDAARWQYLERLLEVVQAPPARGPSAESDSTSPADSDPRMFDQRREWWDSWDRNDYLAVPFSRRSRGHRHPWRLKVSTPHDAFLRHFNLLIHRTPSRLVVREVAPSGQWLWSVPGSFPERPTATGVPTIRRSGSLLLIQSADGVAAISLLEQRVLWQRRAQAASRPAGVAQASGTSPRLIATSPRWVCLRTTQSIEMLDALTGETLWSHRTTAPHTVVACDSCVIAHKDGSSIVAVLDRRSGQQRSHQLALSDVEQIVAGSGTELVIQQRTAEPRQTCRLVWKNPLTGDTSSTVTVEDVTRIQSDDAAQLIIERTDGRLSVVDLQTAGVREYRWSKTSQTAATQSSADSETGVRHDWRSSRLRLFEDSAFVYLILQTDDSMQGVRIPERELTRFRALQAFDRHSGRFLWETTLPESRYGSVLTDQLTLPFIVAFDQQLVDENGDRDERVRLRCFRKRDGTQLIDQVLPSRYSYDEFRISAAGDYSVSAQVHGTRVRFELPEMPSVRQPGEATGEAPQGSRAH